MIALSIRTFLSTLFGSRLASRAEDELLRARADHERYETTLSITIAEQKEEIAQLKGKLERYELVLIPLTSPVGNLLAPKRPAPTFEPLSEPAPGGWSSWKAEEEARLAVEYQEELKAKLAKSKES